MIGLLAQHLLAIVACAVLLGVPGWAVSRLLELQLGLPTLLLPTAWFAFGLSLYTLALLPSLALGWPWFVTVSIHGGASAVLVACALRRGSRRSTAKPPGGLVSPWTLAGIGLCFLLAAALRTRMAFDTLFHVGIVRRLAELPAPTFDTLDRIVGSGVNPAYAVTAWQGVLAAVSGTTGLDPATVVEAVSALVVVLAACAAAGLGRVVTGTAAGEVAAVAAYAFTRVYYPRRELEGDGIAYAFIPGNVALDVLLPLALAAALVLVMRTDRAFRRRAVIFTAATASAMLVVLHANYVIFLALLGGGTAVWLFVVGPWSRDIRRRVAIAIGAVAIPGLLALAALLPVLTLLEHFADPLAQRIDYHLVGSGAWQVIRPGHLYDWFGAPGLIAMLVLPYAVWRAERVPRALLGGGSLAVFAVAFVPPLLDLMGESGSLTLAMRLPRPFGIVLIAAVAVALPALVADVRALAERFRDDRGTAAARVVLLFPFLAVVFLSAAYGYPLARREPPQYGWNWPTLVAVAGVLVVAAVLAVRSRREPLAGSYGDVTIAEPRNPMGRHQAHAVGLVVLALAVCLLPSGATSLRRGAWQGKQLVPSVRADDLGCFAGVQEQLRRVEPGSVLLSDPITAYGAQALAPVYTVADFKTWNGRTDGAAVDERIEALRAALDDADPERSSAALRGLADEFDARYVLVARGAVQPPLDSGIGAWDARWLPLGDGVPATLLARGPGKLPANATAEDRAACDLELWELT